MKVLVFSSRRHPDVSDGPFPLVSLYQDNWDDYGHKCRFIAVLWLSAHQKVELGGVRVAVQDTGFRSAVPRVWDDLPTGVISLGESIAYYRSLRDQVPAPVRSLFLEKMGDVVADRSRSEYIEDTTLWEKSFLRESAAQHALVRGGVYIDAPREEIEPPDFRFSMQIPDAIGPHDVHISFKDSEGLPRRTILFIGRNGTGKTKALAGMAYGIMSPGAFSTTSVENMPNVKIEGEARFSRLITISYNAFDEFPLPAETGAETEFDSFAYRTQRSYQYCGLRNGSGTISLNEIGAMLAGALQPVRENERIDSLRRVLATLIGETLAVAITEDGDERETSLQQLSAGQRLVVAIFSNILGFIEEGSLLLFDEPETNLHPGLLSSVISALDEVLDEFDSYAVIATHSPILLQQVPSKFVRLFGRMDDLPEVKEINFESLGEDLGELTRRALGLADPERDYTHILQKLHSIHGSSEAVQSIFEHKLGIPATAFLRSLDRHRRRA